MYPHYSPIYEGQTNMLPLVYPAMLALKFSKEQIRDIVANYVKINKIKDLNSVYFIMDDFESHYMRRLDFFRKEMNQLGGEKALADYLKDKRRSMSSSLFLGLVRLASAYIEKDDERIAQAIAYYDCVGKELKVTGGNIAIKTAKKSFIALMQKRRYFRGLMQADSESDKIRIIIQNQESLLNIADYDSVEQLELTMLETFAEWFLMTEDHYVLHVILGFHAIFTLKKIIVDYEKWLIEFWLQAQVFSILAKKTILWKRMELMPWQELVEKVKLLNDLEKIKLFHSVYDLSHIFKLDNLRRIAQLIVTQ